MSAQSSVLLGVALDCQSGVRASEYQLSHLSYLVYHWTISPGFERQNTNSVI
ncbi:hypothetical protein DPMN_170757 [Dreissena polymorpha]|uniref:Uncharacterized protein n=1 Tax=Dreissena polymorpha TaxID=45954 RepID=A0A9D4IDH5_DREPO|nr:hypothetical protein DPMN_170757 [Dreissena polymorpha]